ncbi:hypothetical protein KW796_01485 [Candidatus Parcubacteria bacterium]|nr:hypothetical protein [Candidatus Parcubacteria bacterium]
MMKYPIYIASLMLLLPVTLSAATAVIEVDTISESVNALEATVRIPLGMEVKEVRSGDSVIVFWITPPTLSTSTNSISFAGFTPGGFKGKRTVFSVVGEFDKSDLSGITFSAVQALKNDGEGTSASVRLSASLSESVEDTIVPETFAPLLSRSDDVYAGRLFVSFSALDKNTGVAKFEVAETFFGRPDDEDWVEAASPYEVKDNLLLKRVYIKATDHKGNYRVESVSLPYRLPAEIFLAIIIGALCILALRYSKRSS